MQDWFEECRYTEALIRSDRLQGIRMLVNDTELAGVGEPMFPQDEDDQRLRMIATITCLYRLNIYVARVSRVVAAGKLD